MHMTVLADTFLGPPFEAQLNIPFQVDNDQHTQQTGSLPYLQLERIRSEKMICHPSTEIMWIVFVTS
jgi:hypothetical protein